MNPLTLYPCLWYNGGEEELASFYRDIFKDLSIQEQNALVTTFRLFGTKFMSLNGGPQFTPNPSISFMVYCQEEQEARAYWDLLIKDGLILMPFDRYDWSTGYGWVQDKMGISWQINVAPEDFKGQKVAPVLMFCGSHQGDASAAMDFYARVFPAYQERSRLPYTDGPKKGQILHASFDLGGHLFMAMDSGVDQDYTFNEGISFVIECTDQEEIDYYWHQFTAEGEESMCGWCKDPYGVSWQIIPDQLGTWMQDPERAHRVNSQLMKMKKIDWDILENV